MNNIFEHLVHWYSQNKRDLPWRNTREPYKIWISEIMLQQTRVVQVIDYYMTFLRYFPELKDLANADEKVLLKVWQGLGYYSRALNMKNAANSILSTWGGNFPENYEDIRSLKGIGDYTAAAIGSISFGLKYAAIDGNVKRVASRFYGIEAPIGSIKSQAQISSLLNHEIKRFDAGDFNQAIIELGALVCLPRNPKCEICPMHSGCFAFNMNAQTLLPNKPVKKVPKVRHIDFLFLSWKGSTWLQRRDYSSIWKGMYEFPNVELENENEKTNPVETFASMLENAENTTILDCFEVKHQLTHQTIFARFWHLSGKQSNIVSENVGYIKTSINNLPQFPVHRLMHKYLVQLGVENKKEKNTI